MISFLKLIFVVGGLVFLGILFVRRLLLVLKGEKLQAELVADQKSKIKDSRSKTQDQRDGNSDDAKPKKSGDVRGLMKKGEFHFARKELLESEEFFIRVLSIEETHLDANFHLGMTYLGLGNDSKAEFFFQKLTNLKKNPLYYSSLGRALYNQGRLLEAAEAYENAIALDDKRAARFASLARVYMELNNDEKALANFEKASRKSPRNMDYLQALIGYYQKLGLEDELQRSVKRMLELDPYNEDVKGLAGED
ncbi:MAG: tetratricopeptide repeat protein [Patescibacteria group bacterium]|nr:tetratricopeptide repeat protein [Patescibacteria group bacterium]